MTCTAVVYNIAQNSSDDIIPLILQTITIFQSLSIRREGANKNKNLTKVRQVLDRIDPSYTETAQHSC